MSYNSVLHEISPHAELIRKQQALHVTTAAAVGLMDVMKSNLGPTGTLKLLVGGAGQLQLTKDGLTLLRQMQIQHPVAAMIARAATAQDEITGDGTTSTVLLTGAILQQSAQMIQEGLHPRIVTDGLDVARDACLELLKAESQFIHVLEPKSSPGDVESVVWTQHQATIRQHHDLLIALARTSLHTKLDAQLVESLSISMVDAIQTIAGAGITAPNKHISDVIEINTNSRNAVPLDLNRIEIMTLQRQSASDTRLINGLVLDHGGRHPDMPKVLQNVKIMILNVSLEYEQAETASGFVYSTADERERLVESERSWLDQRCRTIVDFKRKVCQPGESFCIINQKGVDPLSLDMFAKDGILCLRRAKRRNLERLVLACGGEPILSLSDLHVGKLGHAGQVREVSYGEDKYTFVEDCGQAAAACTLLIQGPNALTIDQIKDAVHDGLRAVKNAVEDGAVVPGGGAYELAASIHLTDTIMPRTAGKLKLGVQAFAQALLVIPKTLIRNSGFDVQETLLRLMEERRENPTLPVSLDCKTGQPVLADQQGVWDNVRVKRQSLYLATVLANQLLLVDEIMRAGKAMGAQAQQAAADEGM